MKTLPIPGLVLLALLVAAAPPRDDLATARAEIMPLFERMLAAANEHDAEAHLAVYAHDPDLVFVANDEEIVGWDAALAKQRVWWNDGDIDVVYTLVGEPEFRMPAPGLVVATLFLSSIRTGPDGTPSAASFGISQLWQKRPEGWRIVYAHESIVPR